MPIYQQVEEQIKVSILNGELKDDELLPSIRQLAKDLKISVITTTRAYAELEREGYISIVQGKGCFICPKNNELIREHLLRSIKENFSNAIKTANIGKISSKDLMEIFQTMMEGNIYE
nr:GntR family transcriptional regulator [Clostridium estertheticum]